jgi:hypothetical protein
LPIHWREFVVTVVGVGDFLAESSEIVASLMEIFFDERRLNCDSSIDDLVFVSIRVGELEVIVPYVKITEHRLEGFECVASDLPDGIQRRPTSILEEDRHDRNEDVVTVAVGVHLVDFVDFGYFCESRWERFERSRKCVVALLVRFRVFVLPIFDSKCFECVA